MAGVPDKKKKAAEEEDLARQLSVWSRKHLACEVSPDALQQLFHNPELTKIWTHVVKNVVSVTPARSLEAKNVVTPQPPELVSDYKRLCKKEKLLDVDIVTLEMELEVASTAATNATEETDGLYADSNGHRSSMQLLVAYKLCVEKDLKSLLELLEKLDTAMLRLPSGEPLSELSDNVNDCLSRVQEFYDAQSSASIRVVDDKVRSVRRNVKEMVKSSRRDECLKELCKHIETDSRKLKLSHHGRKSDVDLVTAEMDACLERLQASHTNAFIATLPFNRRVEALESEKSALLQQLLDKVKLNPNYSQLKELYELKLNTVERLQIIKCLSSLEIPDGMPSLDIDALEEAQRKMEQKEKELIKNHHHIVKLFQTNKTGLNKIRERLKDDSKEAPTESILKLKLQHSKYASKDVKKNLLNIGEQLSHLQTWDNDIIDLCVGPGQKCFSILMKKELESSLCMPSEKAPEFLLVNLSNLCETNSSNVATRKIQDNVLGKLDFESLTLKTEKLMTGIGDADKKARKIILKLSHVGKQIDEICDCNNMKECLADYFELPAFQGNLL